jgi:hypothetical protein
MVETKGRRCGAAFVLAPPRAPEAMGGIPETIETLFPLPDIAVKHANHRFPYAAPLAQI